MTMTDSPRRPGRPRNRPVEPAGLAAAVAAAGFAPMSATAAPAEAVEATLAPEPQAPERPAMRAPMREEDPRARAAKRAAELRDHIGDSDDAPDDFYIDPNIVPEGWSYEWKRRTVLNQEDPAYDVQLARSGWEAVPVSRHASYMPKGWSGGTIERKGMILMERPAEITEEVRRREFRKAQLQVRQKEEQLNAAPQGQFERRKSDGTSLAKINKTVEAMEIPEG